MLCSLPEIGLEVLGRRHWATRNDATTLQAGSNGPILLNGRVIKPEADRFKARQKTALVIT